MPTMTLVEMTASDTRASNGRPTATRAMPEREQDVVDEREDVLAQDLHVGPRRRRRRGVAVARGAPALDLGVVEAGVGRRRQVGVTRDRAERGACLVRPAIGGGCRGGHAPRIRCGFWASNPAPASRITRLVARAPLPDGRPAFAPADSPPICAPGGQPGGCKARNRWAGRPACRLNGRTAAEVAGRPTPAVAVPTRRVRPRGAGRRARTTARRAARRRGRGGPGGTARGRASATGGSRARPSGAAGAGCTRSAATARSAPAA